MAILAHARLRPTFLFRAIYIPAAYNGFMYVMGGSNQHPTKLQRLRQLSVTAMMSNTLQSMPTGAWAHGSPPRPTLPSTRCRHSLCRLQRLPSCHRWPRISSSDINCKTAARVPSVTMPRPIRCNQCCSSLGAWITGRRVTFLIPRQLFYIPRSHYNGYLYVIGGQDTHRHRLQNTGSTPILQ
jgi:hypothetical protein